LRTSSFVQPESTEVPNIIRHNDKTIFFTAITFLSCVQHAFLFPWHLPVYGISFLFCYWTSVTTAPPREP
jgi:hypothetical protein